MHQIIPFVVLIFICYVKWESSAPEDFMIAPTSTFKHENTYCIYIFLSNEEICRFHGFIRKCFPNKNVSIRWHFQSHSCSSIFSHVTFENGAHYKRLATVRTHRIWNMSNCKQNGHYNTSSTQMVNIIKKRWKYWLGVIWLRQIFFNHRLSTRIRLDGPKHYAISSKNREIILGLTPKTMWPPEANGQGGEKVIKSKAKGGVRWRDAWVCVCKGEKLGFFCHRHNNNTLLLSLSISLCENTTFVDACLPYLLKHFL